MPDLWMDVDAALAEVPVNIMPLLDDTDFKSREEAVAYNAAGLELIWHFVTTAGATSATVVTPTTGGNYDWAHQDGGLYTIEIPASGGASINNDTEGFGWFTGVATGVLPWRGPVIGFRAAGLNNALIDSAYSTTRGLAGTALPDAAADAAGGLPISDAGGLDLDAQIGTDIDAILVDTGTTLQGELDGIQADTEDLQTQIGVAGAGLTAVPWNAAWDAEVQSEATDALNAYDPPTKAELDSAVAPLATAAALATVDGIVDDILVDTGTTLQGELDGIQADTEDLQTQIGVAGAGLTAVPWNAAWDAEVQSEAADALNAYDPPTNTEMEARTLVAANYATAAALTAVDDYVDTEVAAIKAVTDKLDTALELDGAVYRYTTNALEQAPSGGSAPTVEQIRQEMDANSTKLADILTDTGTTLDALIKDVPTVAEFEARTLVAADYTVVSDLGTVQTGDAYARLGAPAGASVSADIAALPTATENADEILKRDWTSVTGEAARSVLNALRFLRNKWSVAGTTLTVTKEDDSTPAWTAALTTNAAADPVTGSDPS